MRLTADVMLERRRRRIAGGPVRNGLTAGLLVLWLALGLAAASNPLHQWLHPDATAASHVCLITVLAQGHLLAELPQGLVAAPVSLALGQAPASERPSWAAPDYRFSPTRAPPLVLPWN